MAQIGAWVIENCVSVGYDDLTLTGAVNDYATFSSAIPAGEVWYAIKDNNGNREEGIGLFDGSVTIIRTNVHITYEYGAYNDVAPDPIELSGSSIVSCTLNASALNTLLSGITTVITEEAPQPPYRNIDDTSEPNTYYKGWADSASTSTATWKILKGIESPSGVFTETWADGDELLDNIWNNRINLIYV